MSSGPTLSAPSTGRINRGQWLALAAALLGWMFDGAEMGVFSLVGRPAIRDLLGSAPEDQVGLWFSVIIAGFLVGAATGGVLFGWLGDRIGRVRAMALSVLVYAVFTGLCGMVGGVWQLLVLRFVAALGMGGEWSLGVALVMEVWPNRSRAFMAGLIGAAGNFGYMLVGFISLGLNRIQGTLSTILGSMGLASDFVERLASHDAWRMMMILGTAPALLTLLIQLGVPESKAWEEERARGATTNWAPQDLLGVLIGALGPAMIIVVWVWQGTDATTAGLALCLLVTVLGLAVVMAGYLFPVVRYLQRQDGAAATLPTWQHPTLRRMLMGAALSGVALLGTWGSIQWAPSWAHELTEMERNEGIQRHAKEYTQILLAVGAIGGTLLAAMMGDWLGRRKTYCLFCLLSLGSVLLLFLGNHVYDHGFLVCAFVAGACTASFYGWLPLYLPELFHTRVRATGQGFGYNFGRILAAVGVLNTGRLFKAPATSLGPLQIGAHYPLACAAMSAIYLVGIAIIWLAPETKGKPLPD